VFKTEVILQIHFYFTNNDQQTKNIIVRLTLIALIDICGVDHVGSIRIFTKFFYWSGLGK